MENWKAVVGYEGRYEVSDQGRVRSVERMAPHPTAKSGFRLWPSKIMKQSESKSSDPDRPYLYVGLYGENKKQTLLLVHALVLTAFEGPRPSDRHVGMHGDDNPSNNKLSNLKWGTYKENVADMFSKGRNNKTVFARGERASSAKLTDKQAKAIAKRIREGSMLIKEIAAEFGVSSTTVSHIKSGKYWGSVTGRAA